MASIDASGRPRVAPVVTDFDVDSDLFRLDDVPDGPVVILVHQESEDMADLRQLSLIGSVRDGYCSVTSRVGSLAPRPSTSRAQLATIRSMAKRARANRDLIADWPRTRAS